MEIIYYLYIHSFNLFIINQFLKLFPTYIKILYKHLFNPFNLL